jgi:hypothetical protein
MPYTSQGIKLTPTGGQTFAVTITRTGGSAVTAYTARNGSVAHTFPVNVGPTDTVEFWFTSPGSYVVSAKIGATEYAGRNGATATIPIEQETVFSGALSVDPEESAGVSSSGTSEPLTGANPILRTPSGFTAGWSYRHKQATFFSVEDSIVTIGWNHDSTQAKQDAAKHQWAFQMEADYKPGASSVRVAEAFFAFTSTDGLTNRRPFGFTMEIDNADGLYSVFGDVLGTWSHYKADGTTLIGRWDSSSGDVTLKRSGSNQLSINTVLSIVTAAGGDGAINYQTGSANLAFYANGSIKSRRPFVAGVPGDLVVGEVPLTADGANGLTADIAEFKVNGTKKLGITPAGLLRFIAGSEQTTVGAAGAGSPLPATPTKYLKVVDSAGTTLVVPAYAAA